MQNSRGSQWAKWDLQVHSPASFFHQYPGASHEDQWEKFIGELAGLPPEFKVIAVCDYLFLDGYRRVRQAWEQGRLPNLSLILPAAEFRLSSFGGTDSHLRRVNAQVIFSDELPVDTIESQFHSALQRKYSLAKKPEGHKWQAVVTRESLHDLGQALIDAAPPKERLKYGNPTQEGFNNINLDLDQIKDTLDASHYFEDRYLLALCKTEWDAVKWNNQSVAEKRHLINSVNLVVMSARDPLHYKAALSKLRNAGVNDTLVDTSDAHYLRSSDQKDRLGNCFTWIKAEPSFKGLLQALREEDRIFVGDEPEKLQLLKMKPQIFLDSIAIRREPKGDFGEIWFDDVDIPLSADLVSIIGNKGTGKSALAESIALAGGSGIGREHLSFLNEDRFCQRKNSKARHFVVELRPVEGVPSICTLDTPPGEQPLQRVLFLPQNYLEQICADRETLDGFTQELDEVVYSHVRDVDKLSQPTLKALVEHLTIETEQELGRLRLELHRVNERILSLEESLTPGHRTRLSESYQSKSENLFAARKGRPKKVPKPQGNPRLDDQVTLKRMEREQLAAMLVRASDLRRRLGAKEVAAERMQERLDNLETEVRNRFESWSDDLELLGLTKDQIVTFAVHNLPLAERLAKIRPKIELLDIWTDAGEDLSLVAQRSSLDTALRELQDRLEAPSRQHQRYLEELHERRRRIRELIGDEKTPGSLRYLKRQIKSLSLGVPAELERLMQSRRTLALQVLQHIQDLRERYRSLHKRVSVFISEHPALRQKLGLEFAVGIEVAGLEKAFFSLVHHGRSGAFYGKDAAAQRLRQIIETSDFESPASSLEFAERVLALFEPSQTDPEAIQLHSLQDQLMEGREPIEVLDLLFGFRYLRPQYVLRMNGRDLKALSPGERGLLLLVFYLLVSNDPRPLIIDQPEGNLDNESIVDILVPCIRQAKKKRQIILVTHNPNLAVVCDSEQIIRASIDSGQGFRVTYQAGAIEHTAINRWLVDVLEGTWPAFRTRRDRYYKPTEKSS